jgi:hypothetical protein
MEPAKKLKSLFIVIYLQGKGWREGRGEREESPSPPFSVISFIPTVRVFHHFGQHSTNMIRNFYAS